MAHDVDYQVREVYESATGFGEAALRLLGVGEQEAAEIAADLRRRDRERIELQFTGGLKAGVDLLHSNRLKPQPLTTPRQAGSAITDETAAVTGTGPAG